MTFKTKTIECPLCGCKYIVEETKPPAEDLSPLPLYCTNCLAPLWLKTTPTLHLESANPNPKQTKQHPTNTSTSSAVPITPTTPKETTA